MLKIEEIKKEMHPRNLHNGDYPIEQLCKKEKMLIPFVLKGKEGRSTIDFSNPKAVLALNKALLHYYYHIPYWTVPKGYLCPPIPSRVDYIHHIADLLSLDHPERSVPKGSQIKGVDVGTGANCIYPLLGHKVYGWSFVASDISSASLVAAQELLKKNGIGSEAISLIKQNAPKDLFRGVVDSSEMYAFTLCNPPFHGSEKEALEQSNRKKKNLNLSSKALRNFGGQSNELWCSGGEEAFVSKMIFESKFHKDHVAWFTSLVAKKQSLNTLKKQLKKCHVEEAKIITLTHGNKTSRIVAWSYMSKENRGRLVSR